MSEHDHEFLKPSLILDLVPGVRCGPFRLGMSIREATYVIQRGSRAIRRCALKFNSKEPLETDILIDLVQDGLLLRFEPVTQRLRTIEIYNGQKLRLAYSNAIFCSPNMAPTFVRVYNHFGPSYPGKFEPATSAYFLHYPGLEFEFEIPAQHADQYAAGDELPVEFPDGTTPIARRITLYKHEVESNRNHKSASFVRSPPPSPPPLPATLIAAARAMDASVGPGVDVDPATAAAAVATAAAASKLSGDGSLYFEEVLVRLGFGLRFTGRPSMPAVSFDSSVQDVLVALGPPSRTFHKQVDKMRIHAASAALVSGPGGDGATAALGGGAGDGGEAAATAHAVAAAASAAAASIDASVCADYFYNYFDLGLDVLFDGDTHLVKKLIVHTNFPSHPDFNVYSKCNYRLVVDERTSVGPDDKWPVIEQRIGDSGQPVVNNKGWSQNPFGAVKYYGYDSVVFEVMANQHIASICLF